MQLSLERAVRAIQGVVKKVKPSRRLVQYGGFTVVLGMSGGVIGCTGEVPASPPPVSGKPTPKVGDGVELIVEAKPTAKKANGHLPELQHFLPGTSFYTGGPHYDGLSDGVRNAIDASTDDELVCPGGKPLTHRWIEASGAGKVTVVGNPKDKTDPNHSIINVLLNNGYTTSYMHVDNPVVNVGQEVKIGNPLGNPSCEFPPGGKTTGGNIHFSLWKDGKPVEINGLVLSGWTINASAENYQGTLTKPGEETRTAEDHKCRPGQCGHKRNDITRDSQIQITGPQIAAPAPTTSSSTQSREIIASSQPTESPKPIAPPAPTTASSRASEKPTVPATSTAQTLDLEAKELARDLWLGFLSGDDQRYEDDSITRKVKFLSELELAKMKAPMTAATYSAAYKGYVGKREQLYDAILSNPNGADIPISLGYIIETTPRSSRGYTSRESGEMRYNFVKILKTSSRQMLDSERKDGFVWDSLAELEFESSHRVTFENTNIVDIVKARAFMESPIPPFPTSYSPWEKDKWNARLLKKKDGWKFFLGMDGGSSIARSIDFGAHTFPSERLAQGFYCPSEPASCRVVSVVTKS